MMRNDPTGDGPPLVPLVVSVAWIDELPARLHDRSVVVVDTLAASTNIATFLQAGAKLYLTNEDSIVAHKACMPRALCIGETRNPRLQSMNLFDCSNSPSLQCNSGILQRMKGREVLYMTNNGTRVIGECLRRSAIQVLVGSFANRAAVSAQICRTPSCPPVTIVPAGEAGLGTPKEGEDLFAARAIHELILDRDASAEQALADSFQYARSAYPPLLDREGHDRSIFEQDLQFCFRADQIAVVPEAFSGKEGLIRVLASQS